jgi:hypothetical protein
MVKIIDIPEVGMSLRVEVGSRILQNISNLLFYHDGILRRL